jgi:hypothetical protein
MDTKLTLKLDKQVIESAKKYAASHKRSLSRIIESYLKSLSEKQNIKDEEEIQISPFVKSMTTGVSIPINLNYKEEYFNHVNEKYK